MSRCTRRSVVRASSRVPRPRNVTIIETPTEMERIVQVVLAHEVEPIVAGLLGGISPRGGPTPEQMVVLESITRDLWGRADIALQDLTPLSPA